MGSGQDLIVKGPTYFSPGDEKAFFDWLLSIPCVADVRGQLKNLHITFKRQASARDLTELKAILRRYRIPTNGLIALKTARNAKWFEDFSN